MAGLKDVLTDVMTRLSLLVVKNGDNNDVFLYTRVWNQQLTMSQDGKGYDYPKPAAFVELLGPIQWVDNGVGTRTTDLRIRIHTIQERYNIDGTFEQDLSVFDLIYQILGTNNGLSDYMPSGCTSLRCVEENPDSDHNNLYHYTLDFMCNFTDSKASEYDPSQGNYFDAENPDMEGVVQAEFLIHRS